MGCWFSAGHTGTSSLSSPLLSSPKSRKKSMEKAQPPLQRNTSTTVVLKRDPEGKKMVNQYVLGTCLGKGSFGKVKVCIDSTDQTVWAIKVLNKALLKKRKLVGRGKADSDQWESVKREIAVLKKLNHPNIVKLREVIDDPTKEKLYLVMEYVARGSVVAGELKSDPIPEPVARTYFRDLIAAVDHIHANHVVHRDIKPENLLLSDDGHIKVADFGVSMLFEGNDDILQSTAGSAAFMAPEMCKGSGSSVSFSGRCTDLWSMGVTLFVFLFGSLPFEADTVYAMYQKIAESPPQFPENWTTVVSPNAKLCIERLLEKNPADRIGLEKLKSHPWVTDEGRLPPVSTINESFPSPPPSPAPEGRTSFLPISVPAAGSSLH